METSTDIADLAVALAKAQASIDGAKKDSANPHFKSKYADLSSVWEACRKALTDNGLSVVQAPGPCVDGRLSMTTMLLHSSGQWIRETLTIPLSKVDAQGYGSATTYARRYSLAAMVGIVQEDDDGNAASQPKGASNDAAPGKPVDAKQLEALRKEVDRTGADLGALCGYYKIEALPELPAARFDHALKTLQAKPDKAPAELEAA